jgi:P27 family predicted phage terminase small subunit
LKGRKPKPTARQIAEGDPRQRGVHKLDEKLASEPAATKGLPACPPHLAGRARSVWKFWAEELEAMDLDRRPDAMMLEGACVNFARAVEADILVQIEGLVIVTEIHSNKAGEVISIKKRKNPAVEISSKAWMIVRAFCSEFGLSPVSRTRLAIGKDGGIEDDLAKLLSQPRSPKPHKGGTETVQ